MLVGYTRICNRTISLESCKMKEAASQQHIRLEAARHRCDLWRNNVGVLLNERGVPVRYGLVNDSPELNRLYKSSDLIGITPLFITPDMVGRLVGVFTAVECKESNWSYNPNDQHQKAQKAFIDLVLKNGGMAGFATSSEDFRRIIHAR